MKQKTPPPTQKNSYSRPGQRQQERLQRITRRRRRQRILMSTIVAVVVIVIVGLGFWQYQQYTASQAQIANQHATATASANDKNATATVHALAMRPAPDKLPTVSGQPVTLSDGLQYIDSKTGLGSPATSTSTVTVIYTGWLQSTGQKFDSTYDNGGEPFSVTLGQQQVIPGWEKGLVGIRSGGTRRLIIPAALAYGSQGASQGKVPIPPNATLIFDVTAVAIK
jgi:FKBP-type peptidyl-prolyl cis-trans isomerase